MAAANGGLPNDLPFGAENSTLNRWRATQSQSRQQDHAYGLGPVPPSTPQYFEDFIAAEIARDKERGVATSPIAPSSISDLSAVQKRWLRRHRKQWWLFLVTLQLSSGSTVAAVVITVQDLKGSRPVPVHLIWLLLSLALNIVCVAVLTVLYVRRRDRREKEKTWAKLEIEKYRRDMQKSQREADRASTIGKRLGREYRSASRAASERSRSVHSERSRSVHSERGSRNADPREIAEVERTYLDYQKIYRKTEGARDMIGVGPSSHARPLRSKQQLPPQNDSGTLQQEFNGPSPPVPPKDTVSQWGTTTNSDAIYDDTANDKPTNLDRFMRDEVYPRSTADIEHKEADHVIRAGHGERGSGQSDENFREMHGLDSDAVSDDSYMADRRRGRSREHVEPWRREQLSHAKSDEHQMPSKTPGVSHKSNGRGHSVGKSATNGAGKKAETQMSALGRARRNAGEETSRRRREVALRSAGGRQSSPQRRPIRSTSAPARSNKRKERMRDV